jgi:hypothetical protein
MDVKVDESCPAARGDPRGELWITVGGIIGAVLVPAKTLKRCRGGDDGAGANADTANASSPSTSSAAAEAETSASLALARARVYSAAEPIPRGARGWFVSTHAVFRRATQIASAITARSSVVGPHGFVFVCLFVYLLLKNDFEIGLEFQGMQANVFFFFFSLSAADHSGLAILAWLASLADMYAVPCTACSGVVVAANGSTSSPPLLREPPSGAAVHASCWTKAHAVD